MEKGIKEWVLKLSKDKSFAEKYEGKSAKEVSELAKEDGFSFTAEDFMDLQMEAASGGGFLDAVSKFASNVKGGIKKATKFYKKYKGTVDKAMKVTEAFTEDQLTPLDYCNRFDEMLAEEANEEGEE